MKVTVPELNLPRVVVIGGGFGGITLAAALRDAPVQVVMFDKHNYHTFQPLLYQVATGGLEPDSIAFPLRKLFKRQRNFHFRLAEVEQVDTETQTVHTTVGEIRYDYLVVATGTLTNYFGIPGLAEKSHGMKSIPEALDMRSLILQNFEQALFTNEVEEREALTNFVVVGGGPTGVETSGALAELKRHILPADYPELDIRRMQIHLVEAGDKLLSGMSAKSSRRALADLKEMGVHVWLNTKVEGYDGEQVKMAGGKTLPSRTVIWSAGVKGNALAGLEKHLGPAGRLKVDQFCRVAGQPRVFAIGDIAYQECEAYPKGHPQVAQVAMQMGNTVARNIVNSVLDKDLLAFQYKDLGSMATIGRNRAVGDVFGHKFGGRIAWLMWLGIHLMQLAGFRNKLVVIINWFWSYVTYDKGTRLIIRPFKGKELEEQALERIR
jgi:NADH dehydrogenase